MTSKRPRDDQRATSPAQSSSYDTPSGKRTTTGGGDGSGSAPPPPALQWIPLVTNTRPPMPSADELRRNIDSFNEYNNSVDMETPLRLYNCNTETAHVTPSASAFWHLYRRPGILMPFTDTDGNVSVKQLYWDTRNECARWKAIGI
jgi:hypothetical protein